VLFTNPVGSSSIARAARIAGIEPVAARHGEHSGP
jgi:multisubunit Na+/H+ antiporter MnhG subunit